MGGQQQFHLRCPERRLQLPDQRFRRAGMHARRTIRQDHQLHGPVPGQLNTQGSNAARYLFRRCTRRAPRL